MFNKLQLSIFLIIPLLLQLIGLVFAVIIDPYIQKKNKKLLLIAAGLISSLIIQNMGIYYIPIYSDKSLAITLFTMYGYLVRPVILVLFLQIVNGNSHLWIARILLLINTTVFLSSFFSDLSFHFTEDLHFIRGPLGFTCHIISGILLLWLAVVTIHTYNRYRKSEAIILIFFTIIICIATLIDSLESITFPVSFLTISVVSSCVFYYIWLHLQFVRDHEQALMAEQRIQIMMTQIQPHFLYNTLSTIQVLCLLDPKKASETTEKFGSYLRQNLNFLQQDHLIPFLKELEHTKTYAEIEMLRFPHIELTYDIQDSDFSLPALTLQPIVENAIRHGVRSRDNGKILIHTYYESNNHILVIEDNGIGFHTEVISQLDDTHIGIRNVKERIEKLCCGNLTIKTRINEGTKVIITIPGL